MIKFKINNHDWDIRLVEYEGDDAVSVCGHCDYIRNIIYININMRPAQRKSTIIHELSHAFRWSYGFELDVEHSKISNAEIEEIVANFVESFGEQIVELANKLNLKLEKEINGRTSKKS